MNDISKKGIIVSVGTTVKKDRNNISGKKEAKKYKYSYPVTFAFVKWRHCCPLKRNPLCVYIKEREKEKEYSMKQVDIM